MNTGRYIFSQITDFIPRYQFDKFVRQHKGERHMRELTSYNHLLYLLYGHLSPCDSLRDMCLCIDNHKDIIYHCGFNKAVDSTTLSRANKLRSYKIFEQLGYYLISIVRPKYITVKVPNVDIDNVIMALDSTTISLSIKLAAWALGKYSRGATKMHLLLDLRGGIPVFVHITDGKYHDSNVLDELTYNQDEIYTMDKAYVDFMALNEIDNAGAYFVTRPKDNMKYEIVETFPVDMTTGVISDQTIRLTGIKSKTLYSKNIRLVQYYDEETDTNISFITNNFELNAIDIANIYRNRWQIEVFFKWIKQNIVIKKLWGYSENAVKTHLWSAICAYLIMAHIKAKLKSEYTITEILTLVRGSLFEKRDLTEMLTKPRKSTNPEQNQNVKEQQTYIEF